LTYSRAAQVSAGCAVEGIYEFAIDGEPGRREFITPLGGVVAGGG
jgi:hypothetical protein